MLQPKISTIPRVNFSNKRKDKIVHPFDGRLAPANPVAIREWALALASKLDLKDIDYIVGFAEGGLIPAYAFSEVTDIPFLGSYRLKFNVDGVEVVFNEEHTDRSHYIYGLKPGDNIIIIEDEITTGRTIINAINSFKEKGVNVKGIGSYIVKKELLNTEFMKEYKPKYLFQL